MSSKLTVTYFGKIALTGSLVTKGVNSQSLKQVDNIITKRACTEQGQLCLKQLQP